MLMFFAEAPSDVLKLPGLTVYLRHKITVWDIFKLQLVQCRPVALPFVLPNSIRRPDNESALTTSSGVTGFPVICDGLQTFH